jgi:hypothetical protein
MESSKPETKLESAPSCKSTYTGTATFLYTSKITGGINLEGICETLAKSSAFSFALIDTGKFYFQKESRLIIQKLNIETTISEQGLTVKGHNNFLEAHPDASSLCALMTSFNLILSDRKLFNSAYGFPTNSARIFMRPIAIRCEGDEEYELIAPYIRVYPNGVISISLPTILGFRSANIKNVVYQEVNKSSRNIESVLCEKELHDACTESQVAQMPIAERLRQRRLFETIQRTSLANPTEIDFIDEKLTTYELVHTDQITLTDIARNLLSVVSRTISLGAVQTRIHWYKSTYNDNSVGQHWRGKPILFIENHTDQKRSSSDNWSSHKQLVDSVMTRSFLPKNTTHEELNNLDLRKFDDFNNFYSEAVSLMLASSQIKEFIEQHEGYSFRNLTADVQVLNEAAHYIQTNYSYFSTDLNRCRTAIDVAKIELSILKFEESLLSTHKYDEISKYIEKVQQGELLKTTCKLLHKKIESVRKSVELSDKIKSESNTLRISIIFGILASATLSPELIVPTLHYIGIASENENLNKIFGIGISIVLVLGILVGTHYATKLTDWISKILRQC